MILKQLIKGHKKFQENKVPKWQDELNELVVNGQKPEVLFVGCSDSRLTPDLMLNTKPGDMFILRNVGNFIPPFKHDEDFHGSAAAIEYAVAVLGVKHIIVCGHTHCGACRSLYEYDQIPDTDSLVHVKTWLKLGMAAKEKTLADKRFNTEEEMYRVTERNSVKQQLKNLLTYPDVKRKLESGELQIHGWHYDVQNGQIDYLDNEEKKFKPLKEMKIED
ncbi:carbonic anhydrase [Arcobacter sp. YIC-80]|uniref:carbonic anhydrase n=1 Tax=unclassified Arcobacter TaxID=2593671 RepID=UPI00384AEDA7